MARIRVDEELATMKEGLKMMRETTAKPEWNSWKTRRIFLSMRCLWCSVQRPRQSNLSSLQPSQTSWKWAAASPQQRGKNKSEKCRVPTTRSPNRSGGQRRKGEVAKGCPAASPGPENRPTSEEESKEQTSTRRRCHQTSAREPFEEVLGHIRCQISPTDSG